MKPATSSINKAVVAALIVAGFAAWWYCQPYVWLGVVMSVISGAFTFSILRAARIETFRRIFFVGLFFISLVTLLMIIADMDINSFLSWAAGHVKSYFLLGQYAGTLSYPCTRQLAQVILLKAHYLPQISMWQTTFPSSLHEFLILMIPYALTGLVFGRSFCGWVCPFGGLAEVMVTGKKERWHLNFLKNKSYATGGFYYSSLKEWVKDTKYGILAGIVLLSIPLSFPLVCIFCPVFWLSSISFFWVIIGSIVIFAMILPFMNKHRWWCFVCPLGAIASLLDSVSLFRIQIDKSKCIKCMDCVQECRMYSLTPKNIEGSGNPDADCIRCGRCIEVCPEAAIDTYFFKTPLKVRSLFITMTIGAVLAWYAWFVVIIADKISRLFS